MFVFEAALFKFKQKKPSRAALFQLPPTSATAHRYTVTLSYALITPGLTAPYPVSGYAAGCSQERRAPTLVSVFEAALFKAKQKKPSRAAQYQAPPTSAT